MSDIIDTEGEEFSETINALTARLNFLEAEQYRLIFLASNGVAIKQDEFGFFLIGTNLELSDDFEFEGMDLFTPFLGDDSTHRFDSWREAVDHAITWKSSHRRLH